MRIFTKLLAATAALSAAAPAAAQYYGGYNNYGYNNYGYNNGYSAYGMNTGVATSQCTAAVQSRLYNRARLGGILGSLVGIPTASYGRVVAATEVSPRSNAMIPLRGRARSGRPASHGRGPD